MIINLNENYRVRSNALEWVLEYRAPKGKKQGKPTGKAGVTWTPLGYHQNPWSALFNATQREVRQIPGEYPAQAQEALLGALNRIETMCENGAEQFKKLQAGVK